MKKLLPLILGLFLFSLISCEKEETNDEQIIANQGISNALVESEGIFKEDIVVTDISGENSIFLTIYSDDKELLSEYLEMNKFELLINKDDVTELKEINSTAYNNTKKSGSEEYNMDEEPKIFVDLITANLKENVSSYSLEIQNDQTKSTKDVYGYPVAYTTKDPFIGVVHKGWGYSFIVQFKYKKKNWLSKWTTYEKPDGSNAWFVHPSGQYYYCQGDNFNVYKRMLYIRRNYYQKIINYRIAYKREDFRGHHCTIGTYDTENCYVGTPPSGTDAFMYPNDRGHFYYTPVNGNQCPRPGSWFDQYNCYVMDIPNSCVGFIYHNKWYVKSDIIY
ncbi:MAG: hypothetical protein KAT68_05635 [Bacteroidales bacterium]|nr:hypothetical protein [Bacteroidales bacterium]